MVSLPTLQIPQRLSRHPYLLSRHTYILCRYPHSLSRHHSPGTPTHFPDTGTYSPGTPTHSPGTPTHSPGTPVSCPGTPAPSPGTITHFPGTGTHPPGTPTHSPCSPTNSPYQTMSLVRRIPFINTVLKRTASSTADPPAEETSVESKAEEAVVSPIEWPTLDSKGRVHQNSPMDFENSFLCLSPVRFRPDFNAHLEVTAPRKTLMEPTQNWCDVWPTAATFKHSVVPLPLRMGYRKQPLVRAPTPAEANLELMKIPNFLHLTPVHIAQQCKAIKKFCTPFPKELLHGTKATKPWEELAHIYDKHLPIKIKYSDYVHQGTSLRDKRSKLFRRLATNHYDENTKMLTLIGDRCLTREQNIDYAKYLLTALYFESRKKDKWEEGYAIDRTIESLNDQKLKSFGKKWYEYRNKPETPETTRKYEDAVRELLGIKKICQSPAPASPVLNAKSASS
uniref:Ribosomal protein S24/S35 mitochondrial conserved domain-containing protein n=1 Tax=Ditylenchus dipsaci TaxID=166011 RepID=A0A915EJ23_9BILA